MHFEILVEDLSGKKALDLLVPKIIDTQIHTFNIKSYKGIGHLPLGLKPNSDPQKRILLDQLPKLIRGYGQTFANYPSNYPAVLIIICDLDDRCLKSFRQELLNQVAQCSPQPETYFCIAIEEGEAWYLGDLEAIKKAYPNAKDPILKSYQNDSVCGTWEKLADAIFPGGSQKLSQLGGQAIGQEKAGWAEKITPYMDVNQNKSPSFCYFRDKLQSLVSI